MKINISNSWSVHFGPKERTSIEFQGIASQLPVYHPSLNKITYDFPPPKYVREWLLLNAHLLNKEVK